MKKLLSLAMAGLAAAALTQPTYAKPKDGHPGKNKGGGGGARVQQRAVAQAPQMRAQARANVQQRRQVQQVRPQAVQRSQNIAAANRAQVRRQTQIANQNQINRNRVIAQNRAIQRSQPSVALGGQTRAERRVVDNTRFRSSNTVRTWDRDNNRWDRDRDDRWRDRDGRWEGGRRYYYRPPTNVYRGWNRDRVYTWNNHRWHWYGNNWVIVNASPDYYYYDSPVVATSYTYSSGSLVADVQRELGEEGYDPGPIDGVLGGQTRDALAQFQRDNGLAVTGRIDSAVLSELGLN